MPSAVLEDAYALVGMNCGEREDEQDDVEAVLWEWDRPRLLGGVAHKSVTPLSIVHLMALDNSWLGSLVLESGPQVASP